MNKDIKQINDLLKKIDDVYIPENIEIHVLSLEERNEYLVIVDENKYVHGSVDNLKIVNEKKGKKMYKEHLPECCDALCYNLKKKRDKTGWDACYEF